MRIFKIYPLSNFQIYNTVLLPVVTILYITSQDLFILLSYLNHVSSPSKSTHYPDFYKKYFLAFLYDFIIQKCRPTF